MIKNCLFCDTKDNQIFENKHFYSIFDSHPVSPGHSLIVSKKHIVSLFDLSKEQRIYLKSTISDTVKIIQNTDFKKLYENLINENKTDKSIFFCKEMLSHIWINKKPEWYNIGNNEWVAAGRTINHLHIHIIPRYIWDVINPIGGIRTIIPRLGDYKN